ncbi:MAG: Ig-like domain-containing protein [Clostridiaceae bacterium]
MILYRYKRITALVLAFLMLIAIPFADAATETPTSDAEIAKGLGVIVGDGRADFNDYLKDDSTRMQAVILSLRLSGVEGEARAYKGSENFKDADSLTWAEGKNILGYVKAKPNLGWVGDGYNFKPLDKITVQQFYKVLLENLGYKVGTNGDLPYSDTVAVANKIGLSKPAEDAMTPGKFLSNGDLAKAVIAALKTDTKAGNPLIRDLINKGAVNAANALNLGFDPLLLAPDKIEWINEGTHYVMFGDHYVFPDKVKVQITKGNLSKSVDMKVNWNMTGKRVNGTSAGFDEGTPYTFGTDFTDSGHFIFTGTVDGTAATGNFYIYVREKEDIISFLPLPSVRTTEGVRPTLPDKVMATFRDNTVKEMPVIWYSFDYNSPGLKTVRGRIPGYSCYPNIEVYVERNTISYDSGDSGDSGVPLPPPPAIGTLVEKVEATSVNKLEITMKSEKALYSMDASKIKFVGSNDPNNLAGNLEAGNPVSISQNGTKATLTLNHDLTGSVGYANGEVPSVRIYFDANALTLQDSTQSQALAASDALFIADKIAPAAEAVYAQADSGTGHDTIVVKFNEKIFLSDAFADNQIRVKDKDNDTVLALNSDYTLSSDSRYLIIKVTKGVIVNHRFSVELLDGSNISDNADSSNAFAPLNNHPAAFGPTDILKADGATPGGTISFPVE